jgi:NADH:ubiquinone oxidoreductase subunit F (NADH-binding)/Pyruvate/2-oxoacid:ferredoxin oxidoreductase delta subunit
MNNSVNNMSASSSGNALSTFKAPKSLSTSDNLITQYKPARSTLPIIYIGTATCGRIAGAIETLETIRNYLSERQIKATIIEVGCLGICSEEPIVDIQLPGKARVAFSRITSDKVTSLLDDVLNKIIPLSNVLGQYPDETGETWKEVALIGSLPYFYNQRRLILKYCGIINPASIEEYFAVGGYQSFINIIRHSTPNEVCELVERSSLRGRAGGGYPVGLKWKSTLNSAGEIKYIICNAQESDPGTFLDRNLIESMPHQLLEGMAIAAYASGASKGYIYIRNEYKYAIELLHEGLLQAREYGLTGHDILGSGFNLEIEIRPGPGAFVCGEETALIGSIEGRRGMPQVKPPYPSEAGLFHKPTVINNVESLCNIPAILARGPEWFNSIGTEKSKGTKLFAISGRSVHTGVIEVPMGTSLHEIIFTIAGGTKDDKKFKALQLGGPNGWCIPEDKLNTIIDYEALKGIGAGMGSGGMIVFDESTCIVDMARYYMDFIQNQSCGKCIPCREGSKRTLEILDAICKRPVEKNGHSTLERFKGVMQLESIASVMQDTSLCGLGVNASNPVLSSLQWFREEFEEHIFDRHCRSGICQELRSFQIEVDKCPGCSLCARRCPENAIIGTERNPYFIVEEKCTGCGLCFDACKFSAIKIK